MKVSLVNDALNMTIQQRNPLTDLLWHTHRGSQYTSYSHKDLLLKNNITASMSRKGNCWDIYASNLDEKYVGDII